MSSRNRLVGCGKGVFFKEDGVDCGFDLNDEEVVPKVDDVSLVDGVLDGAFGGVEMKILSTKSFLGGMMVILIFLEGLGDEACMEAMEVKIE
nr:hypothetical protein [Tanacetum cinerariifolium]